MKAGAIEKPSYQQITAAGAMPFTLSASGKPRNWASEATSVVEWFAVKGW